MKALEVQLEYELKRFKATKNSIQTLFIGGGTPSTIESKLYENLFKKLKPYLSQNAEITSEANPNSATKDWLHGMYKLGVNRISFGVQSLGDTKELLLHDLKTASKLPINHLSAYALTIEEATPFEKKPQMADEKLSLTNWLFDEIMACGLKQYEISNFGSYQSKHNLGYWKYEDYIGLGSGAVGKLDKERYYPNSSVEEYIKNPLSIKVETLSDDDKKIEQIFLGFRSIVGVSKNILNKDEQKRANILVDEKKLYFKNGIFYNNDYLLADEITLFLSS